jgi:uncharacterized protein (TIGR03435 family)
MSALKWGSAAAACSALLLCVNAARVGGQPAARAEFDVVSIKPSAAGSQSDMRTLPDGTFRMTHLTIRSVLRNATPSPVRDYVGAPDWVNRERYDITAKPPAGSTPEQRAEMWRTMFADRMRLVGHVEREERETLGLWLTRSDCAFRPT